MMKMENIALLQKSCAARIIDHIDRNIIRYREDLRMTSKLLVMKKYIHYEFVEEGTGFEGF
ncbi:hypothetical protein [Marinoscillum furvescens]|nr:hypothetical protein [Marinoscillum furvescens]